MKTLNFYNKKILIYGFARTGISTFNFLKKKYNQISCWDDSLKVRKKINKKYLVNSKNELIKNFYDFIVISPGIDIDSCLLKKYLKKNKKKIITDLDIFYFFNRKNIIISVTGTNGKSTTCKLLYDIFSKAGYKTELGGNIGTPVLSLKNKLKKTIYVLELSSYQLAYTNYFKPNYAAILNITYDHIERHKNINNYINAKSNIFKFQDKKDFAFLGIENKKLKIIKKKFKNKKFKSKLSILNSKNVKNYKKKLSNDYLFNKNNLENLSIAIEIAKKFKINEGRIFKIVNSFKGLKHRQEKFYSGKKILCINDSKATSYHATYQSLITFKNIFWILGGLPKSKDKIDLKDVKQNIIKAYIIGKNKNFFIKQLFNKVNYKYSKTLSNAVLDALKDISNFKKINSNYHRLTLLLSPSAASFDQFKNFEERGNKFKKVLKSNLQKL